MDTRISGKWCAGVTEYRGVCCIVVSVVRKSQVNLDRTWC